MILDEAQADWQIGSSIYQGCKKLVEVFRSMFSHFMQAFLHYLSRQNLHCVKEGAIDVCESMFFLIESNFF